MEESPLPQTPSAAPSQTSESTASLPQTMQQTSPSARAPGPGAPPARPQQQAGGLHKLLLRNAIVVLALVTAGLIALWVYITLFTNYVIVPDQKYSDFAATNSIYIKKMRTRTRGFIQIFFANTYNKPDKSANISLPEMLDPDVYSDFSLKIVIPPGSERASIKRGDILFAVVREDTNKDGRFDEKWGDVPMKDWLGRPLYVPFRVK